MRVVKSSTSLEAMNHCWALNVLPYLSLTCTPVPRKEILPSDLLCRHRTWNGGQVSRENWLKVAQHGDPGALD